MIDFTNCPVDKPWVLHDSDGNTKILNHTAEFVYARLIIAENGYEGYYLTREGDDNIYPITNYGKVDPWPDGLFDSWESMVGDILRAQMDRAERERFVLEEILENGLSTEVNERAKAMKPIEAIKYLHKEIGHTCSFAEAKKYWDRFIKEIKPLDSDISE